MAFGFQKASCVVVGTFNIYILHPQWLTKHGLIEEGTEVLMETNLAQPGFRFRLAKQKIIWNITPTRVAVETENPQFDCGGMIAPVLRVLPETPLFALGNNAVYQAELSELEALSDGIRNFPRTQSPDPSDTITQRAFHVGIERADHKVVKLQISIKENIVELLCNVHTDLRGRETRDVAVPAAERFIADRAMVKELAQHFFGTAIDHGTTNDGP